MKILGVVGTKNTGKTALVALIVRELVERGNRVGTIKHTHHNFDLKGKDTWKHRKAGAELVVGSGDSTIFLLPKKMELESILKNMTHMVELDYIIIEGFKSANYPKISTTDEKDEFTITNVKVFDLGDDEVSTLVDLVEKRTFSQIPDLDCGECGFKNCLEMAKAIVRGDTSEEICKMKKLKEVELFIGDKMIPLNPFVQDFLKNTVLGMLKTLKTEKAGDITKEKVELLIRNAED